MSFRLVTGRATTCLRRLIARHRWMRWIPVIACSAGFLLTAHASTTDADAARDAWGRRRTVWIASRDLEPGTPIDAELTELPAVAVPDSAVDLSPIGRIAVQRIGAGETLTDVDVGRDGPLPLLPIGWRAVAVRESPASGSAPGDRVDVVSEGVVLVEDALIVELLGDAILVGVPARAAPLVALANDTGVALLRTGRTGGPVD
jgi:Flp pilus assembly protein CpaB